jgi:16S rRNA processing protein RimM
LSFDVGKIVNAHGVRGEARVIAFTDDNQRFSLLDNVNVRMENGVTKTLDIERVRLHKRFVILKFKGINSADAILPFKNSVLNIPDEKALPLEKDEYYVRDLLGMTVVTDDGEELGALDDVIFTGANDVYAVGKLLIPAIKRCVMNVDMERRKITVKLPEGLRD